MSATREQIKELEADDLLWRHTLFPEYHRDARGRIVPDADQHRDFWHWLWGIERDSYPPAFVGVWNRGGAKSTSAELGTVALGARDRRSYGWYVSNTQRNADDHVGNIGSMLEAPRFATFYPDHSRRRLSKFGAPRGWRRNRLRTAGGLTVDALGLDTAVRGAKLEQRRPDFIVIDDIDDREDSKEAVEKKIRALTETIIPAGAENVAILAIQNLIHPDSVFSQLVDGRAEMLFRRVMSGPVPGFYDLELEQDSEPDPESGRREWRIAAGEASWVGFGFARAEALLNLIGPTAFLREVQHEVKPRAGGIFSHLDFEPMRVDIGDVPDLVRAAAWVDPAVTSTKSSDSQAIQIDGISPDGKLYRLFSWEQISTPQDTIELAIRTALRYGATTVGIETDQGGDTWESVYREAARKVLAEDYPDGDAPHMPRFASDKAGAGHGPKVHRASQMLTWYETDRIRHVRGTHRKLEDALYRFPKTPPLDLVDAAFWSWEDLRNFEVAGENFDDDAAIREAMTATRPTLLG